ncbi:hypothetical protein IAQ61_006526 [Plenodomus lingam]|uniref:uncharacterized protein n=1 Tax=Leptosphaeria maculans TaxID=5022 RepID=UPI003322DCCC|nr:hypothetical protein IAQ61_006526 [Plenodomus lingam]
MSESMPHSDNSQETSGIIRGTVEASLGIPIPSIPITPPLCPLHVRCPASPSIHSTVLTAQCPTQRLLPPSVTASLIAHESPARRAIVQVAESSQLSTFCNHDGCQLTTTNGANPAAS